MFVIFWFVQNPQEFVQLVLKMECANQKCRKNSFSGGFMVVILGDNWL